MEKVSTRDAIKLAARRLFAQRGFDGVAVRDIVAAAGQRNSGSLHYYFGTKEKLVCELVVDGAKLIDDRRNEMLDQIESQGGPHSIRDVIDVLVWPSTNLAPTDGTQAEGAGEDTYIRFISLLQKSHRQLFLDALGDRWASGYRRCFDHIRQFLSHLDPEIVNQRLLFFSLYLNATMASREAALEDGEPHHFWSTNSTMFNLIDTIEAMLTTQPSKSTIEQTPKNPRASSRRRRKTATS